MPCADQIRFIRFEPMETQPVFLRIDGDRAKSEFGGGAKDTNGDFSAIQGQQFFHGDLPQGNIRNSFDLLFVLTSQGAVLDEICAVNCMWSFSFLIGCDDMMWGDRSDRFTENFSYSLHIETRRALVGGEHERLGRDHRLGRDTVEITGVKYAATEELLRVDANRRPVRRRLRAHPNDSAQCARRGNLGARYTIRVPRRTELERVVSSNGMFRRATSKGRREFDTSNGPSARNNTRGALEIETSNGSIDVNDHTGAITGHTSNGRVQVDLSNPEQGRPIRLESSNGGITLKMRSLNGNNVRLSTSNASINLALPENAGAQLRASTSNGHVQSDLPVQGKIEKNHADGKIGAGGPYVELTTSNGSINLQRISRKKKKAGLSKMTGLGMSWFRSNLRRCKAASRELRQVAPTVTSSPFSSLLI